MADDATPRPSPESTAFEWFPVDAPPDRLAFPDHAREAIAALGRVVG